MNNSEFLVSLLTYLVFSDYVTSSEKKKAEKHFQCAEKDCTRCTRNPKKQEIQPFGNMSYAEWKKSFEDNSTFRNFRCYNSLLDKREEKNFTQTPEISELIRKIKHDIFKCQNVAMFNISSNEPSKRNILNLLDTITENLMKLDARIS